MTFIRRIWSPWRKIGKARSIDDGFCPQRNVHKIRFVGSTDPAPLRSRKSMHVCNYLFAIRLCYLITAIIKVINYLSKVLVSGESLLSPP
jgi:hypothetical protein